MADTADLSPQYKALQTKLNRRRKKTRGLTASC